MDLAKEDAYRFLRYIRTGPGCWEWVGYKNPGGYGRFKIDEKLYPVHRLMYEWLIHPVPEGLQVDHRCRNRACVNPAHLEPVTPRENVMRSEGVAAINFRKEYCKNGHLFDLANTRFSGTRRSCRACGNAAQRRYTERKRLSC